MSIEILKKIPGVYGYLTITKSNGLLMVETDTFDYKPNILGDLEVGMHEFKLCIPASLFSIGSYTIYLNFTSPQNASGYNVDSPKNILSFTVSDNFTTRSLKRKSITGKTIKWEEVNYYHAFKQ